METTTTSRERERERKKSSLDINKYSPLIKVDEEETKKKHTQKQE